jgi:hypothetical protein
MKCASAFITPVIQTASRTLAFGFILLFSKRLTGHLNVKQGHVANHDVSGYATNAATFDDTGVKQPNGGRFLGLSQKWAVS